MAKQLKVDRTKSTMKSNRDAENDMDSIVNQFEQLRQLQHAKTDQMILDSVTVLLNSMITTPDPTAVSVFSETDRENLRKILFNILNKYNG